jgi:hypothetical protein
MSIRSHLELDLLLLRYLDAIDRADWNAFADVWRLAETDPELEAALHELHAGIVEDREAEAVLELATIHFPVRPAAGPPDAARPLTAGEVAGRLAADLATGAARMTDADRAANERLQGDPTPLPDELGQPALAAWTASLGVGASGSYWRQFRQTAIGLTMARSQAHARLAAARTQTPPSKTSKQPQPESKPHESEGDS